MRIDRTAGRSMFGVDPDAYERGRPGHPPRVYELLAQRCGLGRGTRVLEVGPGTGQATRPLVELGAKVTALEPDPRLAGRIRSTGAVAVMNVPLEEAELPSGAFDLVVAASSFHWVDETVGLVRVAAALRRGGWTALWWSLFGTEGQPSQFQQRVSLALDQLFAARGVEPRQSPSAARGERPRHGLDVEARRQALAHAGFDSIEHELIPWKHTWDTAGIRDLYASFSPVICLDDATRATALDAVTAIAERDFDGRVELPILTSLYIARRPEVPPEPAMPDEDMSEGLSL